jgi:hypothetical protein
VGDIEEEFCSLFDPNLGDTLLVGSFGEDRLGDVSLPNGGTFCN